MKKFKLFKSPSFSELIARGNHEDLIAFVRRNELTVNEEIEIAQYPDIAEVYLINHDFSDRAWSIYAAAKMIEHNDHNEIMLYIDNISPIPDQAEAQIISRNNEEEIMALIKKGRVNNPVLIIERKRHEEIMALLESGQTLCDEAAALIIRFGNNKQIALLLKNRSLGAEAMKALINRGVPEEVCAVASRQMLDDEAYKRLINDSWHEALQAAIGYHSLPKKIERELELKGLWKELRLQQQKREKEDEERRKLLNHENL